jgi:hypothetical protein
MGLGRVDGKGSIRLVFTGSTLFFILSLVISAMRFYLLFLSQQRYIIMHLIFFINLLKSNFLLL